MTESVGKALATAIKEPGRPEPEGRGSHIFRNQNRRMIFSTLTLIPCIELSNLARRCGIAQNSVKWHLDCLLRSGYIVKLTIENHTLFYPEGLIGQQQVALFHSVNHPKHGGIYRAVLRSPGTSQSDIASAIGESRQTVARSVELLTGTGLLTIVADGRHSRLYPTRLLTDNAENFYEHSRGFSDYITRKLEREGGKPPVVIKKGLERIVVEMGFLSDRFAMDIGINPFMTCNTC